MGDMDIYSKSEFSLCKGETFWKGFSFHQHKAKTFPVCKPEGSTTPKKINQIKIITFMPLMEYQFLWHHCFCGCSPNEQQNRSFNNSEGDSYMKS